MSDKKYTEVKQTIATAEGDNQIHVHNVKENYGDRLPGGTLIGDSTNSLIVQNRRGGGAIVIQGENVHDNRMVQWHGGHNVVVMKDGKNITGNKLDGGFEEGFKHTVGNLIDFFTQPVSKAVGWPPKIVDEDTIVFPGRREDYTFRFNNDANPTLGRYSDTVDITHRATGATNHFANYEYVAFGGMKNISDRINLDHIKAEEEARAAVEKTRAQITPVSETAPQQLSSAKGDGHQL